MLAGDVQRNARIRHDAEHGRGGRLNCDSGSQSALSGEVQRIVADTDKYRPKVDAVKRDDGVPYSNPTRPRVSKSAVWHKVHADSRLAPRT